MFLIVADDLNCALGCYGDTTAFTHIDNLAEQGFNSIKPIVNIPYAVLLDEFFDRSLSSQSGIMKTASCCEMPCRRS